MAAPAIGVRPRWDPGPAARLDPSHPLSQGLWFHRMSNRPGRGVGGADLTWGSSPLGRSAQSASDTTCTYAVPIPACPANIYDFTLHTVQSRTSTSIWGIGVGVPHSPQSGSWAEPWWAFVSTQSFGSNVLRYHVNNGGSWTSLDMANTGYWSNTDGLVHSYTHVWGTQGAIVWKDGAQWETNAATPNGSSPISPTIVGTPEVVFLGRSASTPDEGQTGQHILSAVWTRRLSGAEVAMLHADPFCMLIR